MRSQFFIIASVVVLLNLVIISQNVFRSTFPVSERPLDEFAFSLDLGRAAGDISKAPPYLVKRDLWLFSGYLKSASAWKFRSSLCCQDTCDCPSVNLGRFTSATGESAVVGISSDRTALTFKLLIKSA